MYNIFNKHTKNKVKMTDLEQQTKTFSKNEEITIEAVCDVEECGPDIVSTIDWNRYLEDCEEWHDEISCDDYCFFESIFGPTNFIRTPPVNLPINKDDDEDSDNDREMISLGVFKILNKKQKSFKQQSTNRNIFCNSIINSNAKKCNNKNCKSAHKFVDVAYCAGKCGRITLQNNFYRGNCSKRHHRETIENFLIRKGICLTKISSATLRCYEKPDLKFMKYILESCKKINITEVTVKIVPKQKTLSDIYKDVVEEEKYTDFNSLDDFVF